MQIEKVNKHAKIVNKVLKFIRGFLLYNALINSILVLLSRSYFDSLKQYPDESEAAKFHQITDNLILRINNDREVWSGSWYLYRQAITYVVSISRNVYNEKVKGFEIKKSERTDVTARLK